MDYREWKALRQRSVITLYIRTIYISTPMASEVKTRLLEYLHYKRISQIDFTKSIGVSSTYIGAMRRSISDDKMARIRREYPDLNTSWLLYGEGEMLREESRASEVRREMESRGVKLVPLVPTAAYAGNIQAFSESVRMTDCEMVATQIRGAEMAVKVSGDSMEPTFHDGSVLFIRRINDRAFIPWGNPLVVDTSNGVVVKCLYPSSEPSDTLEARSLNPAYPPFQIPYSSIYGVYRILGSLTVYGTI